MSRTPSSLEQPSVRKWARILLAGPVAIIGSITVLAGAPLWLPKGSASIDNLVIPLVFAPLIWAALFFHACLDRRLTRVALVAAALIVLHGTLAASSFLSKAPTLESAQ